MVPDENGMRYRTKPGVGKSTVPSTDAENLHNLHPQLLSFQLLMNPEHDSTVQMNTLQMDRPIIIETRGEDNYPLAVQPDVSPPGPDLSGTKTGLQCPDEGSNTPGGGGGSPWRRHQNGCPSQQEILQHDRSVECAALRVF